MVILQYIQEMCFFFFYPTRFHTMAGDVVFSTKASSPYDIALVQLKTDPPCEAVPQIASYFKPGNQFSFDPLSL